MPPGGTLEFGENMLDCLIREVDEEVGLDITEATLFSERKMMIGDTHRVGLYYLCEVSDFDAINKEPEKHDEVVWMSFESLPEMFDKDIILTVF
jgi:8-oxo-dGTP pyrophosphatase MutT (NUDIX family)